MRFSTLFAAAAAPLLAVAAPVKWTRSTADANVIVLRMYTFNHVFKSILI